MHRFCLTLSTTLFTSVAATAFLTTPQSVAAFAPLPDPLPRYSELKHTEDSISPITLDPAITTGWQGLSTLPVSSLVRRSPATLQSVAAHYLHLDEQPQLRSFRYRPEAVYAWTTALTLAYNQPAQDARFEMNGNTVTAFQPDMTGRLVDRYQTTWAILDALQNGRTSVNPVILSQASTKTLRETNDLGITELIGRGESKFSGSPKNRRQNIRVGTQKMTGVIIPQGATFSFNEHLGPVEASAGFLPELVIKKTGTVPELGGGLCQVSSTTFRAAMNAGLPIVERRNHSYAVSYYSPQGSDATIYPGAVDLRFTNDTPGSILVWPTFPDENHLVFEFYGTRDNRQVTLEQPVTYDRKPDGSLKASWKRTVTNNGQSHTETFTSVYQSPALFHKQEEFPVAVPPTTPTTPTTPTVPAPPTTIPNPQP
jgi:vancomycin resistance protein YoaR